MSRHFCFAMALAALASILAGLPCRGDEITLKGSIVCNGACLPDPKAEDHGLVVFAIDGTAEIRAAVEKILADYFPEKGLDADAAVKLMDQFSLRVKYHLAPDSPALK